MSVVGNRQEQKLIIITIDNYLTLYILSLIAIYRFGSCLSLSRSDPLNSPFSLTRRITIKFTWISLEHNRKLEGKKSGLLSNFIRSRKKWRQIFSLSQLHSQYRVERFDFLKFRSVSVGCRFKKISFKNLLRKGQFWKFLNKIFKVEIIKSI